MTKTPRFTAPSAGPRCRSPRSSSASRNLPDARYVLLATLAGVAYGWVYQVTRRITASAVTHALVDWMWVLLLRG
ncbi:MAG TPA: CPBP family intramembrane glutamic endopeptidase [Vicinamibacterales bacterium]|nr:CPBP family intramembrane glutamic endopeptidase [Vicinamibacterales bacterium]